MKKNIFWLLLALFTMLFSISVFATETETETDTDLKINVSHFDSEYQIEEYVDEDGFVPVMYNEAKTAIARIEKTDYDRTFTVYHKGIVYMFRRNPASDDTEPLILNSMALNNHTTWGLYWVDNSYQMNYTDAYAGYLKPLLIDGYGWTEAEWKKFLAYDYKMYAVSSYFDVTYRTSTVDLGDEEFEPIDVSNGYYQYAYVINECKDYFLSDKLFGSDGTSVDKDYLEDEYKKATDYNMERLPVLDFTVKQAFTNADIGGTVKYTWTWSAGQHEIYANNPNKYKIQMVASSDLEIKEGMGTSTVVTHDIAYINENCKFVIDNTIPIYQESYSFLDKAVCEKLLSTLGNQYVRFDSGVYYFLFVRVVEPGTENCSVWKAYKCQGRVVTPIKVVYDEEGNSYDINEDDEDDNEPDMEMSYDSDPTTDASKSETSGLYTDSTELTATSLINNLKSVISSLGELPDLFKMVFSWMPGWLIAMIAVGIGAIVLVGFVKLFR